jgi:hypothetical protein
MTVRDIYEATLVEINKENAQTFTTEEFNYVVNKSALALINEKYNFSETNQQLSDDLRVFIKNQTYSITDTLPIDTAPLDPTVATFNPITSYYISGTGTTVTLSTTRDLIANVSTIRFGELPTEYVVGTLTETTAVISPSLVTVPGVGDRVYIKVNPITIPDNTTTTARTVDINFSSSDYLHLISCRITWKTRRPVQDLVSHLVFAAKRLSYDMLNAIQNNTYLKPAPNRPYFQEFSNSSSRGIIPYSGATYKAYQNKPKMRIHVGSKNAAMELRTIDFDYLKMPEKITIYDEDIFSALVDTSQVLEFPDYMLNEMVKRCTIYLLEKSSDPRIQTQPAFNQEIPSVPMNIQMAGGAPKQQNQQQNQQ